MKLKEFETPFDTPPPLMELLVLPEEALPVLCVGVTRDKATRKKYLAIVNPNHPPDKMAQHMDKVPKAFLPILRAVYKGRAADV